LLWRPVFPGSGHARATFLPHPSVADTFGQAIRLLMLAGSVEVTDALADADATHRFRLRLWLRTFRVLLQRWLRGRVWDLILLGVQTQGSKGKKQRSEESSVAMAMRFHGSMDG
jgi:hypothetical protein